MEAVRITYSSQEGVCYLTTVNIALALPLALVNSSLVSQGGVIVQIHCHTCGGKRFNLN